MSEQTATDRLRELLDERGVEWLEGADERKTRWEANGLTWEYFNDENGDAWLGFLGACENDVTPKQAIAVTVGANDGQTIGRHPQPKVRWTTALLSDLLWPDDGSWPDYLSVARNKESAEGGEWRVYVPEDATVGAGTCEVEVIDTGNEAAYEHYEHIMHCKHCNHEYGYVQYDEGGDTWMDEPPKFCPNCGRRIDVSE